MNKVADVLAINLLAKPTHLKNAYLSNTNVTHTKTVMMAVTRIPTCVEVRNRLLTS